MTQKRRQQSYCCPKHSCEIQTLEQRRLLTSTAYGDFAEFVSTLESHTETSGYIEPTAADRGTFVRAFHHLTRGRLRQANFAAERIGYDVVRFFDISQKESFLGLVEKDAGTDDSRGWGTVFVRQGPRGDDVIQVPHAAFEEGTATIQADVFARSNAAVFLMSGAHRRLADVAHDTTTVFHAVHTAIAVNSGFNTSWQLHGYDGIDDGPLPDETRAVLSNGDGNVSSEVITLDTLFDAAAIASFAYNRLDIGDSRNVTVNTQTDGEVVDGERMKELAARTNVQRKVSTATGDTFVHIELRKQFRTDPVWRETVIKSLVDAVDDQSGANDGQRAARLWRIIKRRAGRSLFAWANQDPEKAEQIAAYLARQHEIAADGTETDKLTRRERHQFVDRLFADWSG